MDTGHWIALVIGLFGSFVIHSSQGLMKLGLLRRKQGAPGRRTAVIYTTGLVLNFSAPFWVIVANGFGPTVFYTSMYATGLLWLLAFSCWKLGHRVTPAEVLGGCLLMVAAAVLAFGVARGAAVPMEETRVAPLMALALLLGLAVWPLARVGRSARWISEGVVLGLLGGCFLALDSLLKGVAQADGGVGGFLPSTGAGWSLLALSFAGAGAAFGLTQWAHARGAPPIRTIAGYDAAYVAMPVLLLPLVQPGAGGVDPWCLAGLALMLGGVVILGRESGKGRPAGVGDAGGE